MQFASNVFQTLYDESTGWVQQLLIAERSRRSYNGSGLPFRYIVNIFLPRKYILGNLCILYLSSRPYFSLYLLSSILFVIVQTIYMIVPIWCIVSGRIRRWQFRIVSIYQYTKGLYLFVCWHLPISLTFPVGICPIWLGQIRSRYSWEPKLNYPNLS